MREAILTESNPHSSNSTLASPQSHPQSPAQPHAPNLSELQQNLNNTNLIRHFNNETILLIFLMITLFFVNIYSIIKNQVLKTMNNVISRIWRKIIQHPPQPYPSEKPKVSINNIFEINHCAICLNSIDYEVSVSCFHRFCAHCIVNYWSSQNHSQLKCPICRRLINLLHIDYDTQFDSQEYFKSNSEGSILSITHEIYHYNYLYGNKERSLYQILIETPFYLIKTLSYIFTRDGFRFLMRQINSTFYLFILVGYCLSPIDIIPECIFGILGLVDDLLVFFVVFLLISNFYYQHLCRNSSQNYLNNH